MDKLCTILEDYFATGEGRTIYVMVTYASDEQDAKKQFARRFGDHFAQGCEVWPGVNEKVVGYLFAPNVIANLIGLDGKAGNLELYGSFHFNLS